MSAVEIRSIHYAITAKLPTIEVIEDAGVMSLYDQKIKTMGIIILLIASSLFIVIIYYTQYRRPTDERQSMLEHKVRLELEMETRNGKQESRSTFSINND